MKRININNNTAEQVKVRSVIIKGEETTKNKTIEI